MEDILNEIVRHKREELKQHEQAVSLTTLRDRVEALAPHTPRSMSAALAQSPTGIIAEFKRRSPSKGWIKQEAKPEDIVPRYAEQGAAALSILTDSLFFGGSLQDIRTVRGLVDIPILRKDFILSERQLLEARIVGADAVLLIAACLAPDEVAQLAEQAHNLGLEVLLEIHEPHELGHICDGIDMVGVNNRHLGTFHTDVATSFSLAPRLENCTAVRVSESGLSTPSTIHELRQAGYRGFLMGEAFMKTPQPEEALHQLISNLAL